MVMANNPLTKLILDNSPLLKVQDKPDINPVAILVALAVCESDYGVNIKPRYEPTYSLGGKTFLQGGDLYLKIWDIYDKDMPYSYGAFQVMLPVAYELGFRGTVEQLAQLEININWAIHYVNKRILKRGAYYPEQIADGYNSGSFKDKFKPVDYILKFMVAYKDYEGYLV